eukprot:TRINITY_DN35885_c0_g1_i1.p1 TRINITY_DN35885_c0_g1~~TRINITY_DN35885_c0_g1_i1.p1  ORF type:complete len:108 (+),score=34.52 TRINITY_DN35885_c0_g1_i1:41-325(+)
MDELSIAIGSILPSSNEEEMKEISNVIENVTAEENIQQVEECIAEEAENSVMEISESLIEEMNKETNQDNDGPPVYDISDDDDEMTVKILRIQV